MLESLLKAGGKLSIEDFTLRFEDGQYRIDHQNRNEVGRYPSLPDAVNRMAQIPRIADKISEVGHAP